MPTEDTCPFLCLAHPSQYCTSIFIVILRAWYQQKIPAHFFVLPSRLFFCITILYFNNSLFSCVSALIVRSQNKQNFTTKQVWYSCLTNIQISSIVEKDVRYVIASDICYKLKKVMAAFSIYLLHTLNKEIRTILKESKNIWNCKKLGWKPFAQSKLNRMLINKSNNLAIKQIESEREKSISRLPCTCIVGRRYPRRRLEPAA